MTTFSSDRQAAIKPICIGTPIDKLQGLMKRVDIINPNKPILTGSDIMTKYKIYVDTVREKLCLPNL